MPRICLCLAAKTLGRNLEVLEQYRKYVDLVELRVDFLDPDERFLIRRFPEQACLPVILTIRRDVDGGNFSGGEAARIVLMSKALAFAETDLRRNFAYVDIEEDLNAPSLEEAARTFGTRIIRSCHNLKGTDEDLAGKLRSLRHVGDEIPKVAVTPHSTADLRRIYQAARETKDFDKIILGMGYMGTNTRILTEHTGSYLTYAAVRGEPGVREAAPGQLDVRELAELYRFHEIDAGTRLFGITGFPLKVTASPTFFNKVFDAENLNAVYVPFPSDSLEEFLKLAEELGLEGASVTIPYKEKLLPYLAARSDQVNAVGACNTIVRGSEGWMGYNTDAKGFSTSLLDFTGAKTLWGKRITIIGAGGAARAATAEVYRLKGKALILNRTAVKARNLAKPYRFAWGGLDEESLERMRRYSNIIIQTTPAGMTGNADTDPAPEYRFSGKERVMDMIYEPERTPFLRRAEEAGCLVLNGYDMLLRQARYQYRFFIGKEFPPQLMSRIQM